MCDKSAGSQKDILAACVLKSFSTVVVFGEKSEC